MNREQTEEKIKWIKDTFERKLAYELNLLRVSGPIIVDANSGINDDLGISNPVTFTSYGQKYQVVQSLAKWKRMRLKDFDVSKFTGIYVDMNAIRPDELVDELHSYYVDQWDWEKIISSSNRNLDYLEDIVSIIHKIINSYFDQDHKYPEYITFVTTKELETLYPALSPKERELIFTQKYKAVFIEQIGLNLSDGQPHDYRADDYDDWYLNGDLLYWSDIIEAPIEISSMGIRVDANALDRQLHERNTYQLKKNKEYHKMILNDELPLTIGGGIGQSRLCMLIMGKRHIGEVQSSVWPQNVINYCKEHNIELL